MMKYQEDAPSMLHSSTTYLQHHRVRLFVLESAMIICMSASMTPLNFADINSNRRTVEALV